MRTFKLLLPIITNLVLTIVYLPISYEVVLGRLGCDVRLDIFGRIECHYGVGFFSLTLLICLFSITVIWIIINAKKYLTWDLNFRYMFLGISVTAIIDGVWVVHYCVCYLSGLPDALYHILELWRFF